MKLYLVISLRQNVFVTLEHMRLQPRVPVSRVY